MAEHRGHPGSTPGRAAVATEEAVKAVTAVAAAVTAVVVVAVAALAVVVAADAAATEENAGTKAREGVVPGATSGVPAAPNTKTDPSFQHFFRAAQSSGFFSLSLQFRGSGRIFTRRVSAGFIFIPETHPVLAFIQKAQSTAQSLSSRAHLKAFPFLGVLRHYRRDCLAGDARAGLNVALLSFPQCIAYAAIAGLPIEYGIFGGAIAALVAPLFTGSRFMAAGPSNATAVMILGGFLGIGMVEVDERAAVVPLVVCLAGVFLILGSLLKVAALVQYVSRSVIAGYITAAAFYIILNQIRKVAGFDFTRQAGSSFTNDIVLTFQNLPSAHLPTLALSLATALVYALIQLRFKRLPNVAITLVLMSLVGLAVHHWSLSNGWGPLLRLEAVSASAWNLTIPPLSRPLLENVALVSLVIAFLATLEGSSIGKTIAAEAGERINLNQEMYGLGMANLACGLGQGMPASGSPTRSQLNFASGAKTALASVFTALLLVAGAFAIGRFTSFIPESVLAVIVIAIGLSLLNGHVLRIVWNTTRSDRIAFVTTFGAALLLRLDFAIILGVAVSILLFLRKAAQPELTEYSAEGLPVAEDESSEQTEVSIVHVEGDLFFGAAEIFHEQMRRAVAKPELKIVILKMRNAHHLDATSILALENLARSLQQGRRHFLISEVRPETMKIFRNSGLLSTIGRDNLFTDDPANPTLSTAKAIRRAMKLLEGTEAEVKIFLGSSQKHDDSSENPEPV